MALRTFLFVVSLIASVNLYAQDLKVAVNQKGKVGYKNADGDIVIKQEYDYAEPFSANGIAKVGKGDKYGIINKDGSFVLELKYDEIDAFEANCPTRIKKGKEYGLINSQTGSIILEPKYSYVSRYNCYGLAWITLGGKLVSANGKQSVVSGKMGIIDKNGTIILTPNNKGVFEFSTKTEWGKQAVYGDAELLAVFNYELSDTLVTDCKYLGFSSSPLSCRDAGVMDASGTVLLNAKTYTWVSKPVNNMLRYWNMKSKKETQYGYYDIAAKKENPCQTAASALSDIKYITHGDFHGNIAPVNSTAGWYFVNKNMEKLSGGFKSVKFSDGNDSGNGYYAGLADNNSVIYTTEGNQLFSGVQFSDTDLPNANYGTTQNFAIKKGSKWGLYTKEGTELIAPKYDYMFSSRYDIYFVKKDRKWGAVDVKDNMLIPTNFADVVFPKEENSKVVWVQHTTDTLYSTYNIKDKKLGTKSFVTVTAFEDGMAWAVPSGEAINKGYLLDTDNNLLVDKTFAIKHLDEVKAEIKKNGGKALTSNQANKLILKLTRGEERYAIDAVIPKSGWDY